jgi:anthranilate phosphoribosyltransferase
MEGEYISTQKRLSDLLKKKGIGPEASKSLHAEELEELKTLLIDPAVSLTTKATFITALLTLKPTEIEEAFIEELKSKPEKYLTPELSEFVTGNTSSDYLKIILKAISNQHLSEIEAKLGMDYFFSEKVPNYLKGAFLEAERLKRETFLENRIFFESLWNNIEHTIIDEPVLIDISDSYDGCNRTRHFSVFVASLIASVGYKVYLHGIEKVAPKEAITTHQILRAAGKNPLKSKGEVVSDLLNPSIAWGYIDQKIYFESLYNLRQMRKEMVKRPFLATFEKLLQPITVTNGNYIVTGYTHTHYRSELINQLVHQQNCSKALVLKGVEGSTQISMSRETVNILFDGTTISDSTISPQDFGLQSFPASRDNSVTAEICLKEGLEALENKEGFAKENIVYTAAVILSKFEMEPVDKLVEKLRSAIASGKALSHWMKGCN